MPLPERSIEAKTTYDAYLLPTNVRTGPCPLPALISSPLHIVASTPVAQQFFSVRPRAILQACWCSLPPSETSYQLKTPVRGFLPSVQAFQPVLCRDFIAVNCTGAERCGALFQPFFHFVKICFDIAICKGTVLQDSHVF